MRQRESKSSREPMKEAVFNVGVVGGVARGVIGAETVAGRLVESKLLILNTLVLEPCIEGSGAWFEEFASISELPVFS